MTEAFLLLSNVDRLGVVLTLSLTLLYLPAYWHDGLLKIAGCVLYRCGCAAAAGVLLLEQLASASRLAHACNVWSGDSQLF